MAVISLANLDGSNGFRLDGVSEKDYFGTSVSNAGDVNRDGFDDLIIGAPRDNSNGLFSGASYVVFGKAAGFEATMNLSDLNGSNGFRLDGHSPTGQGSFAGGSVSTAGDINGDGLDDLIVGDPWAGGSYYRYGPKQYGTSYVIFGRTSGFEAALDLSSLDGNNGFSVEGEAPLNYLGSSVSTAGDVNGDGFDDLIVGAPGADSSYIVFGKASGFDAAVGLSSLDGSNGFKLIGEFANGRSGQSVSNAGDVNGDGIDDVIIGDFRADGNAVNSGASYVVFGKTSGFDAVMELSSLNGSNGFRLDGTSEYDGAGSSVSTAGDVNGDGFDDLIVGASTASYVVFGKSTGFDAMLNLSGLNGTNGFRMDGARDSVSTAGDVNGDGFDDVILGAPSAGSNGDRPGSSFVLFGKASGFDAVIDLLNLQDSEGLRFEGVAHNDRSGASVSTAGDINSDGFDDLIVGAPNADLNGEYAGASYVIFGRQEFTSQTIYTGTAGDDVFTGTSLAEHFDAGDGNDRIIGRGGADMFEGDAGDDRIVVPDLNFQEINGGTGTDTLELLATGLNMNLADVSSVIDSVEAIDLSGVGDNTLTLTLQDLRSLSDTTDTFTVNGDYGDRIVGLDDGWTDEGMDGNYHIYTNSGTTLRVDSDVRTDLQARGVIKLESLNGSNGFRLEGVAAYDNFGRSVSNAGDVNGDGLDDFVIGAPGVDINGNDSGSSYIVFGKATGFDVAVDLSSLDGNNGFRLDGVEEEDLSGDSISSAGDVNGDGFDDLIVGAYGAGPDKPSNMRYGASYVIFGKASGFDAAMNLSGLNGSNGFSVGGLQAGDDLGASVSTAGDINGDGFDDVIVGTNKITSNENVIGVSYVLFGKAAGFDAVMDVSDVDGTNGFRLDGVQADDDSGFSVSTAGDINGDGFDDLFVGSPSVDLNDNFINGAAYVMFGKAAGFEAAINLSSLVDNNGLTLEGESGNRFTGRSVSTAGDVNGDGFDDLMIGADGFGSGNGTVYIVFGRSDFGGGELPIIPGTTGDDVLRGTAAAELIDGGEGNDVLIGRGGADVFRGGAGVDQIKVPDLNFGSIDGGAGKDILHLDGKDLSLDLASAGDNIQGIETICIYGRGDNTLMLTADSVLDLSDTSNTLVLHGNAGDRVTVQDDGWVDGGVKGFYHTYTNDDAVLLVGANLTIDFV